MKVAELFEAPRRSLRDGPWRIQNLNGTIKSFADPDSREAREWMSNRDWAPAPKTDADREQERWERELRKEREAEEKEKRKEERKRNKKKTKDELWALWDHVEQSIGNSFPDGYWGDYVSKRWMAAHNYRWDEIDLAVKAHGHANSIDDYLADMWDGMANDAVHDANQDLKQGRKPEKHSPYYHIVGDESHSREKVSDDDLEDHLDDAKARLSSIVIKKSANPYR